MLSLVFRMPVVSSSSSTSPEKTQLNLARNVDLHPKLLGKLPHRTGILLEMPSHQYDIRTPIVKKHVGSLAVANAPNGADENLAGAGLFDGFRERCLVRGVWES